MSEIQKERGTHWPIRPSVVSAFVLGLLVCYVLSAGPMSRVLANNHSGIYVVVYRPLYCITDRLPDPMFNVFNRYVSIFGDVPNLSFEISRDYHSGGCVHCIDHIPFPDDPPDELPSHQTR